MKIKKTITVETEKVIDASVIYASNTSTIPISQLAKASVRPDKFIDCISFHLWKRC
jgi:3-hydroxyacyl-CoA dehydrogenase/enoyl-CoA hydratase/3-hydroxybutyryl-CoA epimerase